MVMAAFIGLQTSSAFIEKRILALVDWHSCALSLGVAPQHWFSRKKDP